MHPTYYLDALFKRDGSTDAVVQFREMRGGRRRYVFPSDFYHPLIRDFLSHL